MSDIAGIIGIILSVSPFLIFDKINFFAFLMICFGFMLMGISRANNLSVMSGKEPVGDEFIKDALQWIKKKMTEIFINK